MKSKKKMDSGRKVYRKQEKNSKVLLDYKAVQILPDFKLKDSSACHLLGKLFPLFIGTNIGSAHMH